MNSIETITPWYGELRTQRGNAIIIRDNELPTAPTGRMYLYNTDRDAFVEYDEIIVSDKLFPLDDDEQREAEHDYGQAWLTARTKFMRAHGKMYSDSNEPDADSSKAN
ncbi:hypothetical protein A9Q78_04030 [Methylophaga sp. 41_12_T18]|nr:hypothetical protein A9Q78_04030 [Methylophaga sp. 41_12_T18]